MDKELREKILEYVQSGQCPVHLLPIYRWWLQRRPEQICPEPIPTIWFLKAGRGCVAAGTPIWDPINQENRSIETMTEPGWVLTTQGSVLASPSYIKGIAPLYRVETETGDVILTTAEHQFLTKRGYVPLREIRPEDEILSLDPTVLPGGDQRWSDRDVDSQPDYHLQLPLCGQSLPPVRADDRVRFPSPIGVLEHIQSGFYLDDSKPLLEYNPLRPEFGPRSRSNSFLDGLYQEDEELPPELLADERFQRRLLAFERFLRSTYPNIGPSQFEDQFYGPQSAVYSTFQSFLSSNEPRIQLTDVSGLSQEFDNVLLTLLEYSPQNTVEQRPQEAGIYGNSSSYLDPFDKGRNDIFLQGSGSSLHYTTHLDYAVWQRIRTVECVGTREFYDIHVPGPNNYLAAGMFHKNSGKTWAAANHIYDYCVNLPWTTENETVYVALVGATFDDVKHTMVEAKSGLLKVIPKENLIAWNRTNGELRFFIQDGDNRREVECQSYTAEKPEKLRGPNLHLAWMDEMAKFKDSDVDPTKASTTWSNMMLGLRNGTNPHVIVTGTPTPCKLVRYLLGHKNMKMSQMTMEDNAENLPQSFIDEIKSLGVNSRAYRQEAMAEVLFDNPDAMFSQQMIDQNKSDVPDLEYEDEWGQKSPFLKVLGFDPSASSSAESDESGIILVGYTPEVKQATGESGGRPVVVKPTHAYVLKDLSGHYTPKEQTQLVIQTVLNEKVDDLVYEQNIGVQYIMQSLEQALKDNTIEFKSREQKKGKKTDYGIVKRWIVSGVTLNNEPFKFTIYAIHAVSGKRLRAEMVSGRYDSNQVHHPIEELPTCPIRTCGANVEVQMTSWDPKSSKSSPDRLDALVYCLLHIFAGFAVTRSKVTIARPPEISQMGSQHGAVKKRKGYAGVYSLDTESVDRLLLPMIMEEGYGRAYDRDVL